MKNLLDLIFQRFITNTIGIYSRFYFLKLFKKNKSISYLSAEYEQDGTNALAQQFLNRLVGMVVFVALAYFIAFVANQVFY